MRRPNCEQLLEHPFLAVLDQQDAQKAEAEQRSSSRSRPHQQSAQKQRPMAEEAKRETPCSTGSSGRAVPDAAAPAADTKSWQAGQRRLNEPSGRHATISLHVTWAYCLQQGHFTPGYKIS